MSVVQAGFALVAHNPDVLTCIANLSNDEVFTPPAFANQMLDTLESAWAESNGGSSIWSDSTVTFLDPFTKSGVFLREIVARLTIGLAGEIPDLQQRVDHILTKQVFGIGITTLTSLLARRSVYCSKYADGVHSIAKGFDRDWGNIWFERTEHTWAGDRCACCGANKASYERSDDLESHAYAFIHTSDVKARINQIFGADMQFDVVIGNPPYQLSDDSQASETRIASAGPIYQLFVEQAKKLEPRFLSMVIPSRWMAGGRGLDSFRSTMLADRNVRALVDYPDSAEVFGAGVRISGGACYFLWARSNPGPTSVTTVRGDRVSGPMDRELDEYDVFVRDVEAVEILRKIVTGSVPRVSELFQSGFGFDTNFTGYGEQAQTGDLAIHLNVGGMGHKRATRFVSREQVARGEELVDAWKVFVPSAAGYGAEQIPDRVLGQPIVAGPGEVCTQTYRVVGPFDTEAAARSFESYYRSKFFRFLVSLRKITQHASPSVYSWVPLQSWDRGWADEELFEKYGLLDHQMEFIESVIRPLPATTQSDSNA